MQITSVLTGFVANDEMMWKDTSVDSGGFRLLADSSCIPKAPEQLDSKATRL